MEKILREILTEDKNILNRREDLIDKLDEKVPNNLTRDCLVIKNALRLNVGEFFYSGEVDKVREILKSSGMNEARINFVVDTFTNALGLNEVPVVEEIKIEPPPAKIKGKSVRVSLSRKLNNETENNENFSSIEDEPAPARVSLSKKSSNESEDNENFSEPPPAKIKGKSVRVSLSRKLNDKSEDNENFSSDVGEHEEITETFKAKNQPSDLDNEYNTVVSTQPPTNTPSSVITTNQPTFPPPVQPNPQPVAQQQSDFKTTLMNYKDKLFTTEGRLNRWAYIVNGLKLFGLMILGAITSGFLIGIPILIAAVVGNWMITIRRLHDLDKSGWWSLVSFVPYVNIAFGIYVLFFKGTTGPNRFGPDPLMEP